MYVAKLTVENNIFENCEVDGSQNVENNLIL